MVALGGVGFLSLAQDVAEGETRTWDLRILQALRVDGRPKALVGPGWLHVAATDVTALGSITVLSLIILLAFSWLASLRRWTEGLLLVAGAGGGLLINAGAAGGGAGPA